MVVEEDQQQSNALSQSERQQQKEEEMKRRSRGRGKRFISRYDHRNAFTRVDSRTVDGEAQGSEFRIKYKK